MQNRYYQITIGFLLWLLAVLFVFGYTPTNDTEGYIEYARICLAEHQPYPCQALFTGQPFIWNIGSINLVAASLWLFGSVYPLLLLFCLLKALTALLLALTTERLLGRRAALAVLILYVLYPNNWGQSTTLMSEIPSAFLTMWAVWLIVCRRKWWQLLTAGILLALANWFRPTAILFIVALSAWLLYQLRKQAWTRIAAIVAGYLLAIVVIGMESRLRTGHFIYQAESLWCNMVDECYDNAPVAPHYGEPLWQEGRPRYIEGHEQLTCFECADIWRNRSMDWLKDHKLEYLSKIPGRLFYMYGMPDIDNMNAFLSDKSKAENNYITIPYRHLLEQANTLSLAQWLALLNTLLYYSLVIAALVSIVWLIYKRQTAGLFLPLVVVVFGSLALALVMHGETRFKDPFMPYVFMLAASWFSSTPASAR